MTHDKSKKGNYMSKFVLNEERSERNRFGSVYTNDTYELVFSTYSDDDIFLVDLNDVNWEKNLDEIRKSKGNVDFFDYDKANKIPTVSCYVTATNGKQEEITINTGFLKKSYNFNEIKYNPEWQIVVENIEEADKLIRSLYSGKCILQTDEDVKRYEKAVAEQEEKISSMRINDYYEHLRKQGYGINENTKTTDFPFDVTEDFRNFTDEWNESHKELFIYD